MIYITKNERKALRILSWVSLLSFSSSSCLFACFKGGMGTRACPSSPLVWRMCPYLQWSPKSWIHLAPLQRFGSPDSSSSRSKSIQGCCCCFSTVTVPLWECSWWFTVSSICASAPWIYIIVIYPMVTINLFTTSESPKYSNPPIFCCLQKFVFFLEQK